MEQHWKFQIFFITSHLKTSFVSPMLDRSEFANMWNLKIILSHKWFICVTNARHSLTILFVQIVEILRIQYKISQNDRKDHLFLYFLDFPMSIIFMRINFFATFLKINTLFPLTVKIPLYSLFLWVTSIAIYTKWTSREHLLI